MSNIHKNEVFRVLTCNLSIEQTSLLCDVSIRRVKQWDKGVSIPESKRKLMELFTCVKLDHVGWSGWFFRNGVLQSPFGFTWLPQQLDSFAMDYRMDLSDEVMTRDQKRSKLLSHYRRSIRSGGRYGTR